jgi:hypothetical protein
MAAQGAAEKAFAGPDAGTQLGLYERVVARPRVLPPRSVTTLCAGCRAKEARYGFRDDEREERPRTLCFECFRMELDFRQRVTAQRARGWNAEQACLPLAETLRELSTRRRRAQIAARRALGA